jgi:hypothetical protein
MCQIPTEVNFNSPDDVIRYIVDNNPQAVRNNFSRFGINIGGLTPCMMKDRLIAMNNQGYDIKPILNVPYNPQANNYTNAIGPMASSAMKGSSQIGPTMEDGSFVSNTGTNGVHSEHWLSGLGNAFAGLGAGIGSLFGGGQSPSPTVVQVSQKDNTLLILGGLAIAVVLVLVLLKK